ncbi:hypothetical protein FLA105534_04283 [Flavobacterium bizetiae]|uniref:Uncharacterized protein n=1 Tax=Flavobacterium bizetiae TaxID=2704140 RepID=A0A6J4GZM3_9FLAO|nr:hypothetical protein [Flavobacterium bizetiae]CAA9202855.1 hypothetical protein FLA105534_04283 [Flavobacterium bizetiae]CAD5343576.1 hypothetical protein FLA105535_03576 [Flavobacterium bizetiae]CAD5349571.1 hypothetical protein FLA105534_03557 [Flavobacterium bizetiae]
MKYITELQEGTKIKLVILLIVLSISSYYFFKNYKTTDLQLKILSFIGIVGSVWLMYNAIYKNNNVQLLKRNFELTTGKIEKYIVPNIKGAIPSLGKGADHNYIKYSYEVNNNHETNSYDENYFIDLPDIKPNLDMSYLVIYEKSNPANSFILVNYPINDSADLDRYRKIFSQGIPDDTFKQE